MLAYAAAHGIRQIALPRLGAGLGRLDWDEVKGVMERIAGSYEDVELYVIENYKAA